MSGTDLARALAAIGATRNCPIGLRTTVAPDDPELAGLPPQARVIAKNEQFMETLTERLIEWGVVRPARPDRGASLKARGDSPARPAH